MNQQKSSKGFKEKVTGYLKALCSGHADSARNRRESAEEMECKPIHKRKRLTFVFQEVLIRLSRKNLVLQEFQTCSATLRLPLPMERHISSRLVNMNIVVLCGGFSDHAAKSVPFSMKIVPKSTTFLTPSNTVLSRGKLPLRVENGCIDVLVEQIRTNSVQNMEKTLAHQPAIATHHIFVCHQEITPQQLSPLIPILQGKQMMEIQRVMVLDKCIFTVVYVSRCNEFLKVDQESLLEFFFTQMTRIDPCFDRTQLAPILEEMLGAGYYPEVSSSLARMIGERRSGKGLSCRFLTEMKERYPYTSQAAKKCQPSQKTEPQTSIRDQMVENTPLFGIRPRNSTYQHYEVERQSKRRRSSAIFNSLYREIGSTMVMEEE